MYKSGALFHYPPEQSGSRVKGEACISAGKPQAGLCSHWSRPQSPPEAVLLTVSLQLCPSHPHASASICSSWPQSTPSRLLNGDGGIWQCQRHFVSSQWGRGCYWHLEGQGQDAANTLLGAQDGPTQGTIWPRAAEPWLTAIYDREFPIDWLDLGQY